MQLGLHIIQFNTPSTILNKYNQFKQQFLTSNHNPKTSLQWQLQKNFIQFLSSNCIQFYKKQFLPYVIQSDQTYLNLVFQKRNTLSFLDIQHVSYQRLNVLTLINIPIDSFQNLAFLDAQNLKMLNIINCNLTNLKSFAKTNWSLLQSLSIKHNPFNSHQFSHLSKARYVNQEYGVIYIEVYQKRVRLNISTKYIPPYENVTDQLFKLPIYYIQKGYTLLYYIKNRNKMQVMRRKIKQIR